MPEPIDVQPPSDVEGSAQVDGHVSTDSGEGFDRERFASSPIKTRSGEALGKHALNLGVAAFTGYALATLLHRRPKLPASTAPARSRPTPKPTPPTSYRAPLPNQDSRSSIRFR